MVGLNEVNRSAKSMNPGCPPSRAEQALTAAGKSRMYELGPGAQIKAMMKRIDNPTWKTFKNVAA